VTNSKENVGYYGYIQPWWYVRSFSEKYKL